MATNVAKTAVIIVDEDGDYIGPSGGGGGDGDASEAQQELQTAHLATLAGGITTARYQTDAYLRDHASGLYVDLSGDIEAIIGAANETAAANPSATSGLNGILKGYWTNFLARTAAALTAGGGMKVGLVDALPAGTAAIGKLAANSGVDIGDVDVTSLPADPLGLNADAAVSAGATGSISAKLRSISRDLVANVVLAAGSNLIGQVRTPIQYVDVVLTLEATALDAGDVAAATQIVAACTPGNDIPAMLHSATFVDANDQKAACRFVFLSADVAYGTEDAAPSISDADALNILGHIDFAVADYVDHGGVSSATKTNIALPVKPGTGTDDIWVAMSVTATPTFTTGTLRLGFI